MSERAIRMPRSLPGLVGTRREMLIGGVCAAAALTAFAFEPRRHLELLGGQKLDDLVPRQIGAWHFATVSGLVLPPQDQLRDKIYNQLLTRVYNHPDGSQIMFLVAYNGAQDGVIQIHRPEVCYPASGYGITRNEEHRTALAPGIVVPSRFLIAEDAVRREQILYWTRVGSEFPDKWAEQRWAVFKQNLEGYIPDGLLVRISTVDPDGSVEMLDGFARELFTKVGPAMQKVLAGPR